MYSKFWMAIDYRHKIDNNVLLTKYNSTESCFCETNVFLEI